MPSKKKKQIKREKQALLRKIWLGISIVIMILSLVSSVWLVKVVKELDVLPTKIFTILIIYYVVMNIIIVLGLIQKKKLIRVIAVMLSVIVILLSFFGVKHGTKIANFMNSAFNNDGIEVTEYNIAVLKSSNYKEIKDLDGTTVAFSIVDEKKEDYVNTLNSKVNATLKAYDNPMELYQDLLKKKVQAIVVTEGLMQVFEEEDEDVNNKIKVIYNFEIEKTVEKDKEEKVELKPISILISGSDSRSSTLVDKTRSDVNMIVTVNPDTHKVLLTSIPRDYYVQLHGKKGIKDKLTNSGIYGINMTKQTIEDLFDIKIDYTVKVGFQSVIKIVDLVGGVDIYSDTAFTSHCDDGGAKSVKVKVGMNHFNGAQALSYARERYAYRSGDHHRIKNQQQVLEAVINKVTSNKKLLLKYDKILDSLKGAYKTNIPTKYIKLMAKEQIDNMPSWKIETQQVGGGGANRETYSAPGKIRSVVIPDMNSVVKAKDKIVNVIEGN